MIGTAMLATEGSARERRLSRWLAAAIAAAVYVAAGLLLLVPSMFLAFGVQALGAANGWWTGDPTTNDGEESWATAAGVVAYVVVLVVAASALRGLARRLDVTYRTGIVSGTIVLVAGAVLVCAWVITAAG